MLDYAIVFALGFLIAGLVGFAMLPVVWNRALRLTRARLETGIPISIAEVRAGQDHIRAEAAMNERRLEARIEAERDRRHLLMADVGRQTEIIRRLTADNEARLARLRDLESAQIATSADALALQEDLQSMRADLASTRVTLAIGEEKAGGGNRQLANAQMEIDGLRVEIVALRTKLGTAESELVRQRRDLGETTAAGVERDGRLALLGAEISKKNAIIAVLEASVAALERQLAERAALPATLVDPAQDPEGLASAIRRRDARLVEQDGRLAFAAGREAELTNEIARLKADARRTVSDLAGAVEALRTDRRAIEMQLDAARSERAFLQDEVAVLKREARDSWGAIEGDNQALRMEMARIAAEIVRQAERRRPASLPAVPSGLDRGAPALLPAPLPAKARVDAP